MTRSLLAVAMAAALGCGGGVVVNDVHSQLNETRVERVVRPGSVDEVQWIIRNARMEGRSVSISGGRHAMGGQQFGAGTILLDMRGMNKVLAFDSAAGQVTVAGWDALAGAARRSSRKANEARRRRGAFGRSPRVQTG